HAYGNIADLELVNLLYEADQLPLPRFDSGEMRVFKFMISTREPDPPPLEKPLVRLDEETLAEFSRVALRFECEINGAEIGKNLMTFALFVDLLTMIGRAGGAQQQPEAVGSATAALNYINLHYREKIDVDYLAKISCLSRQSLFRRFRDLTGSTPGEFQREKKLGCAEELLRTTELSLSQIATECGFCDANHLTKLFSVRYGVSPGKMRRKFR
ncbi:MAG: AraC family transcriptional regulator, partial [Bacteroidales bacterium]|nr:AraC family transcriptional regulator [Bacteroidales bacterium]